MLLRPRSCKCFWLLPAVLIALGQAGATEFHYYGLPLSPVYGVAPGADNRITVHVTLDLSNPGPTTIGTMSDGTHTISNGPNGNGGWVSCDMMFEDGLGNLVYRCTASIVTSTGCNLILQANSTYTIYWPALDESICGTQWDWKNAGGGLWFYGQDFGLTADPAVQSVKAGKVVQFQLALQKPAALTETVTITCESAPTSATCSIASSGVNTYIATIDTSPGKKGTPKGTYKVIFRASTPSLVHDTEASLIVK